MPETLVFFAVLWQESVRLELRTKHASLPVAHGLEMFYYYQFGNFVNGYINAFLLDGLVWLITKSRSRGFGSNAATRRLQAFLACALSMAIIVFFELVPTAYNHADALDIPAGLAGALLYLGVRLVALRHA